MADFMTEAMGNEVSFDPLKMILTSGGTPALEILSFCLADPGNAFLVPAPYYPGYCKKPFILIFDPSTIF